MLRVLAEDHSPSSDELSREELSSRFVGVRAAVRNRHADPKSSEAVEDQTLLVLQLMRTRMPELKLNRVTVKPSALHGRGLFVLRNIEQDELITLYPGDALIKCVA